jgi:hypothetical protein
MYTMVVQTTLLESDLAILELPHALEGTITKTVAQDLLKRMQELAVSLAQVPPAVVIAPAQPAGRLIGRTNVKPATKLAISRMRVAVANLIDHKGSNLFVGTSTGTGSTTTCNTDLVEDCHPGILEEDGLLGRQLLVTKVDQGSPGVLDHATGATRGLVLATFLEIAVFERRSSIDRGVSRKGKKCHKDRGNGGGVHHGDNEVGGK